MLAGTQGSWSHIVSAAMSGEREMNAGVLAFSIFSLYSVLGPSTWAGATHILGGSSLLKFLEIPLEIDPGVTPV